MSITIEKFTKLKKAMKNRLASIWKNQGDLAGEVAIAIMKAKSDIVRSGWMRGSDFNPEEDLKKINKLQEENKRLSDENANLQQSIKELTTVNDNLEFDDEKLHIGYKSYLGGNSLYKDISLKDIFASVSIHLIDVSVTASGMEDYIAQAVGASSSSYMTDQTMAKRIYNQFIALNLMQTKWVDGKGLYIGLTKKGAKLRDELNLFKKQKKEK